MNVLSLFVNHMYLVMTIFDKVENTMINMKNNELLPRLLIFKLLKIYEIL